MTIEPEAGRVLGCLVEKQLTTPQQYPLTLNALLLACNQTTNRDPVVALDDGTVMRSLGRLKELRLVRFVLPAHGRSVTRYRHVLDEVYGIDSESLALLAVLLLHGEQTPGELRSRAGRMAAFPSVDTVHAHLEILSRHPEGLIRLLPRRPGQKEDRWQQLVAEQWPGRTEAAGGALALPETAGPVEADPEPGGPETARSVGAGSEEGGSEVQRPSGDRPWSADLADLRAELSELRASLAELDASVADLRRSLD